MAATYTNQEQFNDAFIEALEKEVKNKYEENIEIVRGQTQKNNVTLESVTVRFDEGRVAPNLYLDDFYKKYQDGERIEKLVERAAFTAYEAYKMAPSVPELSTGALKEHVTLNVINTAMNEEMLKEVPHFSVAGGELSAIPRWQINEEMSFIVSNTLAESLMMTPDEVLQAAQINVNQQEFSVRSMKDIMSEMMVKQGMSQDMVEEMLPETDMKMLVITTSNNLYGSKVLLSEETLNKVYEDIGPYVILPSSIHEIIAVPASLDMSPDDLRSMIMEVNSNEMAPQEILSNCPLLYDGQKLTVIGDEIKLSVSEEIKPEIEMQHSFSMGGM